MSKPIPSEGIVHLSPDDQVKYFADLYRRVVNPVKQAWFKSHCVGLGLHFNDDELIILAALDTPDKVQQFLNTQLYYNNDHASVELEETAMPPRCVLQTGMAHCFEGAMFAYAVDYLHGHNPRLVVLEASQDSEHNLVVYRDPRTGEYGCNAHSAFPNLDGRRAEFASIRAMGESYMPFYYSDRTHDPNDLTLIGYSDEFDLIAKYGTTWMASEKSMWDIYYTYIDDTWRFHYFFDTELVISTSILSEQSESKDREEKSRLAQAEFSRGVYNEQSERARNDKLAEDSHLYPLVRALKENWIRIDAQGKPFVSANDLPSEAHKLWDDFWREYGANDGRRPQGKASEFEKEFFRATGTTPIDLEDNAFDFQFYLDAGYHVEQIMNRTPTNAD
ncbi:MAG: hypothetical protein HZB51_18395 [Chloroflexi bacterium]|nr:hypothetical protein [Chloroflexota bacterium]